jgi:hemolysin-activating ACP:hemolysin acyltransferase
MNDLRDALKLWTTVAPFKDYISEVIGWRVIPAHDNNKLRVYRRDDGEPYAMLTFCFLNDEEAKTEEWCGHEAYKRESGDQLWVTDMIANGGRSDVLKVSTDVRKFFYETFPEFSTVHAIRGRGTGNRRGWYPNKGLKK